jgi:hypothetical protein
MAYRDFTLAKFKAAFSITLDESHQLFQNLPTVAPSERLAQTLAENQPLATAIGTEKARSEFLIAPILAEVRRRLDYRISLFSGSEFNVDAGQGLTGDCDFILSASSEQYFISAPIVIVIEAKNENIIGGLGQCAAAMLAAQQFNAAAQTNIEVIYGAVTSGTNWKFLSLRQTTLSIDLMEYHISQIDQILAILLIPFQTALLIQPA